MLIYLACPSLEAKDWSAWHLDVFFDSQSSKISVFLTYLLSKWA